MTELFLDVVNLSISAGWLVWAVLAARFILKKAPKWVSVLLWGIVAVRLICPFSIESALSLIPSAQTLPEKVISGPSFEVQTGIDPVDQQINEYLGDWYFEGVTVPANHGANVVSILAVVWCIGVLILLTYTAISYLSLRRKLSTATILRGNIYQCETVNTPFVLGILKPRIYLPYHMDGKNLRHVVAHERAHIRRKDHWWKPLGFLLLSIHWFNPLMWVAYILLCRDIELACDEKVIAELGNEQRADYTQALVACSIKRHMITACPLAFGEVGVKERVKSVMNYKKPAFWVVVAALAICLIVAVCFLTDPNPTREFPMTGNNVSDLNPEIIVNRIMEAEDLESSEIYVNSNNFSLTVDSDFNWADSQAVRYFFVDNYKNFSAQLRIFPDEDEYFLTEHSEWDQQECVFLMRNYLDAIKYLPQDAIQRMAPADQYIIQHREEGAPQSYERVITYTPNGVQEINSWVIHLEILPQHEDGGAFSGIGDEVIHVFYGRDATSPGVLSVNDLLILSQKGYDLTWTDFEKYDYAEVGSGLYIRLYKINEQFELWVGGTDTDSNPMYIYLALAGDLDTRIDIRNGGVAEFIQAHDEKNASEMQLPEQDQTLPDLRANGAKSFSQQELISIYAYAEKTDQGIRMIETNNSFVSGRLIYTVTDIRVAKHADELPIGIDGFTCEACLTKDENYRWTEGIRPDFIDESGAFAEGWCVVVVDITVYNDDAAMLIGENSNHDPYVFRADSLLNIADCSKPAAYNYPYSTPDYFSQINRGKGHEFAFRLEPGEETSFSIGFMVSTELMLGAYDLRNLKLCKTSGSVNACMIDIVSGEDDDLLGSTVSKPATSHPQNQEVNKAETAQALEELGDFSPEYLPAGYEEVGVQGSPLPSGGWYSYVRKWYDNKATNSSIYFEYETYAIDTDSGYTDDARTICSLKIPGNDILNGLVNGEETQINGMYGLVTENRIVWADPKVHKVYYLFSEDVTGDELLKVAQSICDHTT